MKTLIIYRTFLGSSKKYAEWLHEAVPSDLMKFSKANAKTLEAYDAVVMIGGTYMYRPSLLGYIKKNWKRLQSKKVVFVTVAGAPEIDAVSVKVYAKVPEKIRAAVKHFHLRGKAGKQNADEVTRDKIRPIADYLMGK
jgi:menaquinone-dependent protoporphyrinogen IX oxidase